MADRIRECPTPRTRLRPRLVAVALTVLAACGRDVPPPPPSSQPPPEPEAPSGFGQDRRDADTRVTAGELRAAIDLVNRGLPMVVDDVTRLDRIAIDDNRVVYRYTAALERRLDAGQRAVMDSALAVLARRACNTVLARRAFDAGFDLRYEYVRLDGATETGVDITRASCAAAARTDP